jgi:hypothetical protein
VESIQCIFEHDKIAQTELISFKPWQVCAEPRIGDFAIRSKWISLRGERYLVLADSASAAGRLRKYSGLVQAL